MIIFIENIVSIKKKGNFSSSNIKVWNMNFWNFYRGHHGGFDVLLHQKHYLGGDTTDKHSFLIVAERLSTPEFRKLLAPFSEYIYPQYIFSF